MLSSSPPSFQKEKSQRKKAVLSCFKGTRWIGSSSEERTCRHCRYFRCHCRRSEVAQLLWWVHPRPLSASSGFWRQPCRLVKGQLWRALCGVARPGPVCSSCSMLDRTDPSRPTSPVVARNMSVYQRDSCRAASLAAPSKWPDYNGGTETLDWTKARVSNSTRKSLTFRLLLRTVVWLEAFFIAEMKFRCRTPLARVQKLA